MAAESETSRGAIADEHEAGARATPGSSAPPAAPAPEATAHGDVAGTDDAAAGAPPSQGGGKSAEDLKTDGNVAFKRAQLLRRTTAGKQYLSEARAYYAQALRQLGEEEANEQSLGLACTLHANLAAVFLLETPPRYEEAKAAAELALTVDPRHVKALYRRALAYLEDERVGLPESSLRAARDDLRKASAVERGNTQVATELARIERRLAALEETRRVPAREDVVKRIPEALRDRGGDCLAQHRYLWGQTEAAVHIFLPVPVPRALKASDVAFEVKLQSLRLELLAVGEAPAFILEGPLHKRVRPDDCDWQLEEGGFLLHVELAKRDTDPEAEHWFSVWADHAKTKAPSARERAKIREMAHAACRAEAEEGTVKEEDKHPAAAETLKRLRELCPGVNIQWGDTSLNGLLD